MTPEELYRYDINGYLLLKGAIRMDELARLNELIDVWEDRAGADLSRKTKEENLEVR